MVWEAGRMETEGKMGCWVRADGGGKIAEILSLSGPMVDLPAAVGGPKGK